MKAHSLNIIFIKPNKSTFIDNDQRILEQFSRVHPFLMQQLQGKLIYGIKNLQLFFSLLSKIFCKNTIFVCWFADYHAAVMVLAAKFTGKKSVIFVGGQETICYPELNKGVYLKKIRGLLVKYALKHTNLIVANHGSLLYHENHYYNSNQPHIDGITHYVEKLKTPVEIVFNGIDTSRFIRDKSVQKQQDLILTVGTMSQKGDFYNKGFDLFVELAARNPQLKFVLVGLHETYKEWFNKEYNPDLIPNLQIYPYPCPSQELNQLYNKAKVFVQASITEGMPNTLSEAMLLECIPVGSNVNGIPDAIGDTGVIVKNRHVEELEKAVYTALKMETATSARERVLTHFSYERREQQLHDVFRKYFKFIGNCIT